MRCSASTEARWHAAADGLTATERLELWPRLAAGEKGADSDSDCEESRMADRDAVAPADGDLSSLGVPAQILLDAARGWHFRECAGWSPTRRTEAVRQLAWTLTRAFGSDASGVRGYWQGAHDVAAVLLLWLPPASAERALRRLLRRGLAGHAAPASAPGGGLAAAQQALALLARLLELFDPALAAACARAGVQEPHYALSWLLTWFAHDFRGGAAAARLFDLFLAGHPLLPVYAAAALVHLHRDRVLALRDPDEVAVLSTLLRSPRALAGEEEDEEEAVATAAAIAAPERVVESSEAASAAATDSPTPAPPPPLLLDKPSLSASSGRRVTAAQVAALTLGLFRLCPPGLMLASGPAAALHVLRRDWPQVRGFHTAAAAAVGAGVIEDAHHRTLLPDAHALLAPRSRTYWPITSVRILRLVAWYALAGVLLIAAALFHWRALASFGAESGDEEGDTWLAQLTPSLRALLQAAWLFATDFADAFKF